MADEQAKATLGEIIAQIVGQVERRRVRADLVEVQRLGAQQGFRIVESGGLEHRVQVVDAASIDVGDRGSGIVVEARELAVVFLLDSHRARKLVADFGSRVLWGSDWPHPNLDSVPDDGQLVDLIGEFANEMQRQALLVDNPQKLYKFES